MTILLLEWMAVVFQLHKELSYFLIKQESTSLNDSNINFTNNIYLPMLLYLPTLYYTLYYTLFLILVC